MKYFLHDTNSFQDEKVTEVFIKYGYEGLGLFYTILEKIAMQEKPIKTAVLKKQLSVGKKLEKVWNFLEQTELIYSNNGETFNENILKFSEKYQIKKEKTKERVSQWRENQTLTENVTCYESVSNTPKDNISKVKESKVNISKEDVRDEGENLEISISILKDFGFNEISDFNKLQTLNDFIFIQKISGRLEYFLSQYKAYMTYKKLAEEKKHNLGSFIGKQENQFKDGAWESANWELKLTEFNNGKSRINDRESRQQTVDDLSAEADRILNGG